MYGTFWTKFTTFTSQCVSSHLVRTVSAAGMYKLFETITNEVTEPVHGQVKGKNDLFNRFFIT